MSIYRKSQNEDFANMTLDEFINQPDVVDFTYINSSRFRKYIEDKPFIKIGTDLAAGNYTVAYTTREHMQQVFSDLGSDYIDIMPQLLSLLSLEVNTAAGIFQVQHQPYLNLTGRGVIIGIVDTGIDFTKDAFKYEDGSSKITALWDQTIEGKRPESIHFGAVYSQSDITAALKSADPKAAVPSTDDVGHGTFLASVAAGREDNNYIGAAPDAEIVAVKVRSARAYHRERFFYQGESELYESTDFLLGLKFVFDTAGALNRPVVICIGMGTNFGGHDGNTVLEDYITDVTQRVGIVCVAAAGNESNKKHHTNGKIATTGSQQAISINVGMNNPGFPFYIWNSSFDKITVEVISPIGETTSKIPITYGKPFQKEMTLEPSIVTVYYYKDSSNVAIVVLERPTQGVWNIILNGDSILSGEYHAWLPITGVITPDVEFLTPTPDFTIVVPATANRIITVGAYNNKENSLYTSSSWGPTRSRKQSPDFVAPGVDVAGVYPTGYGTMTGTSVSAAVTTGAAALLLQWGIVEGHEPSMDLDRIKALLISGCTRVAGITYPNSQWGYGSLNLFNVFDFLKES